MGICDNSLDISGRGAANKESKTARLEESKEGSILPSFLVICIDIHSNDAGGG